MAKEKGKKFKRKGKKICQPNAKIKEVKVSNVSPTDIIPAPDPLTYSAEATASDLGSNSNGGATQGREKETEKTKRVAGFIFMCNPRTKIECYQYRVFGLPLGEKEVVKEIKPGAKLFLYDFQLKLLYGIYEATSAGNLNLEPAAFGGKFPSQVKFKIFKECLPLHESSLRHVIKENYTGSKFKQEISAKQVRKLVSTFRSLSSSSQPTMGGPNISLSGAIPPSAMENQFKHTGRVMEVPYLAQMQYSHIRPLADAQPVPQVNYFQHGYHAGYVERIHPTLDHQSLPATSTYYVSNSQRPSFAEGVAHGLQEPPYSRYRTVEERAPHDQVTSYERYLTTEQRGALYQDNIAAYNSNPTSTAQYTSSVVQTQVHPPYHPMPLQQYQESAVAHSSNPAAQAQYTASVLQPQGYATYLPIQREALYQDNLAAYNSNPTVPAHYNTTSSVAEPQVLPHATSQGNAASISSYYIYSAANQ